jgi:hypothetical protein
LRRLGRRGAEGPLFHGTEAQFFQGDAEIFEDVRDGGIKKQVPPLSLSLRTSVGMTRVEEVGLTRR